MRKYIHSQSCIQPNPLVVTLKDESVKTELVEAIVTVKLGINY